MKNVLDLRNKRVLVVGLGKSGLASARLLHREGARVIANDARSVEALADVLPGLEEIGAEVVLGSHPESLFTNVDRIVVSPGVPNLSALMAAEAAGIPITGEIELASHFLNGTLVGITGSNGKSTVTTLIGLLAETLNRPNFTGGNLGTPMIEAAFGDVASKHGVVVAEMSSFQLERVTTMRVNVALLLNISENHLDRHGSLAAYAAAKAKIFAAQEKGDAAIVHAGDALCESLARMSRGTLYRFGGTDGDVRVVDGDIVDEVNGLRVAVSSLKIVGSHNLDNACAAALAGRLMGATPESISRVLTQFPGLSHRVQFVKKHAGVTYIDDSKATNVGATVAAINGLDKNVHVVLIAGGKDKGGSYVPMAEALRDRSRAAVLIGEATPLIEPVLREHGINVVLATTMSDAVQKSAAAAKSGDVVLLSPACASFDMFKSYAHRAEEFVHAVHALPEVSP